MPQKLDLLGGKPKEIKTLYHGSKSGLDGKPRPTSRAACDFGRGWYLGTMREQAFSMVAGSRYPASRFYEVSMNTSGLNIIHLDGMQWLAVVLYNRGELKDYNDSRLASSVREMMSRADVLVGLIADDNMPAALSRFADGSFSDVMLYQALTRVTLGDQWVALTHKACDACAVREVKPTSVELKELAQFDADRSDKSKRVIQQVEDDYYGVGRPLRRLLRAGFVNTDLSALPSSWEEVVRGYSK